MTRTFVTVTVPRPCAADWEQMTPTQQGRHCAACTAVVVDFTRLSDAELLAWFARSTTKACGRFRSDQLDRPLPAPARPLPARWQAGLAVSALTLTLHLLAPTAANAQRPTWPSQHLQPLFTRVQGPSSSGASAPPAADQASGEGLVAPVLPAPAILGGAVPGLVIITVEPPRRTPLLQLEDWLR